ncbi:SAV_2336 N-terminal domain-related protein, partial [Micromonospora aurantiaca (nom. illeg.)]|uniref:SAV_2336 N-terminal domain-related protein n=1 Tax=Micromonospora aurantiaca (nom. illeg.) TaxID=47850 RepID=UPI00382F28B2
MIDRLAHVLAEAFPDHDGEHLADALWLVATRGSTAPTPGPAVTSGREHADAATPTATRAAQATTDVTSPQPVADLSLPGGRPGATTETGRAIEVGLRIPIATPSMTTVTALSLFRRVRRPGRPVLDIDATVDATADAKRLVIVTRSERERGLDVAVVVDRTPGAMVWAETITELEGTLRRTGAFRSVTRWSLDQSMGAAAPARPRVRDSAGAVHHADHLVDPAGRRLVLLLTDGTADAWRGGPLWQVLRRWAQAMPTALVHLLPEPYWAYTAIGQPTAAVRSPRPASPNSSMQTLTAWWSDEDEDHSAVSVPVFGLRPEAIMRWTRAVVTGSTWTEAIRAHPRQATAAAPAMRAASAAQRVRVFQARASEGAQRLARILAGAPVLSLPLIRVLHEHLVPHPETGQVAELMVGGLMERLPDGTGRDSLLLRFRPGVADLLYEGTTTSQEWDVYEVLSGYLERHGGSGDTVRAVLADPRGTTSVDGDLVPFAAMGRGMAMRLGLDVDMPADSPQHGPATPAPDGSGMPAAALAGQPRRTGAVIVCVPDLVIRGSRAATADAWISAMADGLRASGDGDRARALLDGGVSLARYADLFDHNPKYPAAGRAGSEEELRPMSAVSQYFADGDVRQAARDRVAAAVTDETRVIVAFSFGAVVAYEALCQHPEWPVRLLVTLESPLGGAMVFDRLDPAPAAPTAAAPRRGSWPGSVDTWVDLVNSVDAFASGVELRTLFGSPVTQHVVSGTGSHRPESYLASPVTGAAISAALRATGESQPATPTVTDRTLSGDGRRYLLLCNVTEYLDPNLTPLPAEPAAEVVELFAALGYAHVAIGAPTPTREAIFMDVARFLRAPDRRPDDLLVLYLSGHGVTLSNGEYRFLSTDSVSRRLQGSGVAVAELAQALFEGSPVQHHLVIVDSSFAGQAAREFASLARRYSQPSFAVIASTGAQAQAHVDAFPRALSKAMRDWMAEEFAPSLLRLDELVSRVNDRLAASLRPGRSQRAEAILLSPVAIPFFPRSPRRVEVPSIEDFVGRRSAIADITAWLADPSNRRPLVVTGDPGSGKTALLNFVAAVSDPRMRRAFLPSHSDLPPVGAIIGTVSAAGSTAEEVVARLGSFLMIDSTGRGLTADLSAVLSAADRRTPWGAVAIDAIDESRDPSRLLHDLIAPLVRSGRRLRLLLATRRVLLESLSELHPVVMDLDTDQYADPYALRSVVRRVLTDPAEASELVRAAPPGAVDRIAARIADVAGTSFLHALLAAKALAARSDPIDLNAMATASRRETDDLIRRLVWEATPSQAGDEQTALTATIEAVEVYRRLAEANPAAYLPDLARSVSSHAVRLAEVGRRVEALEVSQEAVTLYRELVNFSRDAYLPDLARSVSSHAVRLAEVGRRVEALEVSQEAV